MSVLLHLLPLLVVGCVVLHTLSVCGEQVYKQDSAERATVEEYLKIFQNDDDNGQPPTKKRRVEMANERAVMTNGNDKHNELLKVHMPIDYDYSKAEDQKNVKTIALDGYIIVYSTNRKIPLFTAERIDGTSLDAIKDEKFSRKDNEGFRPLPAAVLPKESQSTLAAYKGTKFDRGHNIPYADMTSAQDGLNSFFMVNMAPQYPKLNREAWRLWENYTREKAKKKKMLIVITGTSGEIGKLSDGTVVPKEWYKLLVWCDNGLQAEYILIPHVNENNPKPEWGTTDSESGIQYRGHTCTSTNKDDVQKFLETRTKITFKLNPSDLCTGSSSSTMKDASQLIQTLNEKTEATAVSTSFCQKLKKKLYHLKKIHKMTLTDNKKGSGKSVLDLGKGSFSAGCRKFSELVYTSNANLTEGYSPGTYEHFPDYATVTVQRGKTLVATVTKGKSVHLLELFNVPKKLRLSAINLRLKKVVVNCAAKYVDIHSAHSRTLKFIPGLLSIKNAALSLRIKYGVNDSNIIAGLTGQWALGSIYGNVLVRYETKNLQLLLKVAPRNGLTVNLKNELDSLTGTYVPIPLPSVSLTNIVVTGQIDLMKGGVATIVVSGSIGRNRVHAVFQKPLKYGKFTGAFAADIGPFKLSYIIKKTTEVDISRVPFFGSLVIPRLGVTVSSEYITGSLLPMVFCKDGLLQNTAVTIPKGLQAFTVLNLRGTKVPVKFYYYKKFLSFEVIKNGRLPIGTLLSTIPGVNIRSLPLPPRLKDIFRFQIDSFYLDTNTKEMVTDFKFPGTLRYFNGYLTITKPAIKVLAVLKHPRGVNFEVDGALKIGKGDYSITISRDPSSKKYVLKASFKTIPVSVLIHRFSAKILPSALQRFLKKFIQFSIHNAKLAFPLGTRNLQIHLSGVPIIDDYKTIHMSAVIVKQGGNNKIIQGFQFGKVNFVKLLYKITRKNLRWIAILNQDLDTSLVISPVSLSGVYLYGSKLKHIKIVRGVTVHALLQWPRACMRDKFCAVAQRLLGKRTKLSLQASFESVRSFTLYAGISGNVRLGSAVLERAALQIKIGQENAVGIEGTIHLKRYRITLIAGIRVGTRGVVLQGNMQGCWKRAFGAKWLTICNLHLLIAIQPTVTLVGALEIGGEVRIGNPFCTRHPLIALGYMGVDQLNPQNNFYYVKLKNKVTMKTLLQTFCIKFHLPRPLADSGFPRGFLSSYSPIGKELPKAHISIPAGFRLKGALNIFGLVAEADVIRNYPKGVNMNIALSPLRIGGGRLQMYASRHDRSRGPFLKAIVESYPRRKVDIHARGFVSVLGIQAEAMLRVTNSHYEYMISGKFLHLFHASLRITASYGNINHVGFRVRGYLKNDFFAAIRGRIHKGLQSSSRAASRAIENAKRKVNSKKAAFNRAIHKLHRAQHRVNSARGAFDRAIGKLRSWEGKVRRLCRMRHCGSICIGCPGPWRCWKSISIWGRRRCVLKRPTWRRCCRRITDPVCKTRNAACWVLRKAALAGLRGARFLVGKSRHVLHVANAALRGAMHFVRISRHSLNIVVHILEGVKRAYQAGTKALSAIARFGLGGVFDIRELMFDVALSSAATGHFKASVLVSIFRHMRRFTLNINLRSILSFVKAIGERVIGGLGRFIS